MLATMQMKKKFVRKRSTLKEAEDEGVLTLYLKEVSKHKMLSVEEEQEVGKELAKVRSALIALDKKYIKKPENDIYITKRKILYDKFVDIRNVLVNANLRFVITIVKRFSLISKTPLSDLINEGNVGLIKAAEKFDYTKGFRFVTYAAWWIRQTLLHFLHGNERLIRLPAYKTRILKRYFQAFNDLSVELQRDPTINEVATYLGYEEKQMRDLLFVSQEITSLDTSMCQRDAPLLNILDVIEDTSVPSTFDAAFSGLANTTIFAAMETYLEEREMEILKLRYGLDGEAPLTLREVGDKLELSRERIRQLQGRALEKIQFSKEIYSLKEIGDL